MQGISVAAFVVFAAADHLAASEDGQRAVLSYVLRGSVRPWKTTSWLVDANGPATAFCRGMLLPGQRFNVGN